MPNDTQLGNLQTKSDFADKYVWQDLFWDLSLISCVIEGLNGAFYSYPHYVYVGMVKK